MFSSTEAIRTLNYSGRGCGQNAVVKSHAISYHDHHFTNSCIFTDVGNVWVLAEHWHVVIYVRDVDHNHGDVTERSRALSYTLDRQVIFMANFEIQASINI